MPKLGLDTNMVPKINPNNISIVIPSRDRPDGLVRVINSVRATTDPKVEIIAVIDLPDARSAQTLRQYEDVRVVTMPQTYVDGHPQQKYQAGYDASDREWVITGADDITFHNGWLDALIQHPNKGFIGLFDSFHKHGLATLYAVSKEYTSKVMNGRLGLPWYYTWFADVEWCHRARLAKVFTVCEQAGFDHHHYVYGTGKRDRIAKMSAQWHGQDSRTFKARKEAGFPEEWPEV